MPVIQQENGVAGVKGLPARYARRAYNKLRAELKNGYAAAKPAEIPYVGPGLFVGPLERVKNRYEALCDLLDEVTAAPLPLDVTDAHICVKAQEWAEACQEAAAAVPRVITGYAGSVQGSEAVQRVPVASLSARTEARQRLERLVLEKGIAPPLVECDRQAIARMVDPAWWRRQIRRVHGRAFERAAIRLGFVSLKTGVYCSDETARRRQEQNKRNARVLRSVTMSNGSAEFSLAELVAKSTGSKSIRRKELMLRIAGFEEIALECGHDGVFVTLTCPSKFHAVHYLTSQENPKYNGAVPPEAQRYLCKVWARIRAAVARAGIALYGFRVVEPHHDGCPHWHMVLFVQPTYTSRAEALEKVKEIFQKYALAEDGDEPGAAKRRCEVKDIDRSKGSAAAYIVAYVSKNIDGDHIEEHKEGGAVVGPDLTGDEVLKPCHRVEAWATKWGIRQFQQIGGAPVTVWRELRRVTEATVKNSPGYVLDAWAAAQRVEIGGEVVKAASWAEYLRAQGGAVPGRDYRIGVATRVAEIAGRYGMREGVRPVGIFARAFPDQVYESVRHTWTVVARGAAVDFPWTRVINCTEPAPEANQGEAVGPLSLVPGWYFQRGASVDLPEIDAGWWDSQEYQGIALDVAQLEPVLEQAWAGALERKAATVWTEPRRRARVPAKMARGDRT